MSFISAVAGPSRIPYGAQAVARAASACSAMATGARRGYAAQPRSVEDADEDEPRRRRPVREELPKGMKQWTYQVAYKYKHPVPGQRAKWLGDEVPYGSNPAFCPPPPLSNDLMTVLADELRAGKRTIGQISQAHNVSKHRLEAIRKLKDVEDEFIRQKIPLQRAYQECMEELLGVQPLADGHSKAASVDARRLEELARLQHLSTRAELEEEHVFGEGRNEGSFGNMVTGESGNIQKDAWEMQDEGVYLEKKAKAAADAAARKAAELAEVASGTDADSLTPKARAAEGRTVRAGETTFRFVDTSKIKKQK